MTENNKDLLKSVAHNVLDYRRKANLSQDVFAEKVGLHRTYIGAIERCERNLTVGTISLLAQGMGVRAYTLLIPPSDVVQSARAVRRARS